MNYDDFDDEYEEIDVQWADFWSRSATDYENHSTYNPCIIRTSSGREPGYGLLSDLGVNKCMPA